MRSIIAATSTYMYLDEHVGISVLREGMTRNPRYRQECVGITRTQCYVAATIFPNHGICRLQLLAAVPRPAEALAGC